MCGIAGFTAENDLSLADKRIHQMTQKMDHRGPDGQGHFLQPGMALGHLRLSILDLSDAASQPMYFASERYVMVFNGEIYNFREIKSELKEFSFKSEGDSEVIMAAYAKWGVDCLEKFNGMFALAIYDQVEESLFIARDRLGIKPLYYYLDGEQLVFASEVRALLASEYVPGKINKEVMSEYLRYYSVNAPNTLIEGVYMLPPGHLGIWKNGDFQIRSFWSLAKSAVIHSGQSYEETCRDVRRLLREGVERRLISDVALGAFLSGGIDSSAIVALMAESSTRKVNTFSVVFDEKAYDESEYSDLIARKYATEHHPIKLKPEDFLRDLPEALASMDHPSGDGLNSYVVSKVTRQAGFTVALSGLGGDELFAGYPVFKRYEKLKKMRLFYGLPHGIRSALGKTVATVYQNHKTERLRELISLQDSRFDELYPIFRKRFDDDAILELTGSYTSPADQLRSFFHEEELSAIDKLPFYSQVSVGEIQTYTQNVLLRDTDQMSMASSLEVRVPFFDHTLVEYALGIPDEYKKPVYPKKLLVDALGDLLPGEIVHRPKMGFMFPWEHWIREDLRDFCGQKMEALAEREIFNPVAVRKLWSRFLQKDAKITWIKVWMLVALEDWIERNGVMAV